MTLAAPLCDVLGRAPAFALGLARQVPMILSSSVLLRNGLELLAIMSFIVALANMPIADVTTVGQVTPLLVLLGAWFLFGQKLGSPGTSGGTPRLERSRPARNAAVAWW